MGPSTTEDGTTEDSTTGATEPPTSPPPTRAVGPTAAPPGVTLAVTCAATLLVLMNYTAPMTVLPQMAAGVGADLTGQTWILNGISLGLAALLLVAGSLADDYGRRRLFVVGAGLLAAASVVCAVAGSTAVLVVARVVQGGASAALIAASLGIVGNAFPAGPSRVRATGLWGAMLGAGIALGPLASGGLTQLWNWRSFYWLFGAAAAVVAVLAAATLRESRATRPRRVDVAGVATLGPGLAALLAAVTQGREGWARPAVLVLFGLAFVLLLAFVAVEARGREPMLDLTLFRRPEFLVSTGGAVVTGLAVIGLMSYLPTVLQHALGQTPLSTAALFGIWSGTAFVSALQARRLRLRGRTQLAVGLALSALGSLVLFGMLDHWSAPRVVAGLAVGGVGSGLVNAALARLAIESVPADRASMGSGANNTARYIGSSLGVAMVVALVSAASGPDGDLSPGVDAAVVVAAAIALVGAVGALVLRGPRSKPSARASRVSRPAARASTCPANQSPPASNSHRIARSDQTTR